ncbi:MAG: pyrimidine/purine nucleoside phosphorylase [Bacteroidales bacterium]|nr:pyrimidine/purine nucleoside phosphorylase [Bacteroidales bacterium]
MFKINTYYDGNVQSIGFETTEGKASVGVMNEGEYEFGTSQKEIMKFTSGKFEVKLPGACCWKKIDINEAFEIEANKKFNVKIIETASYICLYR